MGTGAVVGLMDPPISHNAWVQIILAPDIPKSKTKSGNMLSDHDILQQKLILRSKIQNL